MLKDILSYLQGINILMNLFFLPLFSQDLSNFLLDTLAFFREQIIPPWETLNSSSQASPSHILLIYIHPSCGNSIQMWKFKTEIKKLIIYELEVMTKHQISHTVHKSTFSSCLNLCCIYLKKLIYSLHSSTFNLCNISVYSQTNSSSTRNIIMLIIITNLICCIVWGGRSWRSRKEGSIQRPRQVAGWNTKSHVIQVFKNHKKSYC